MQKKNFLEESEMSILEFFKSFVKDSYDELKGFLKPTLMALFLVVLVNFIVFSISNYFISIENNILIFTLLELKIKAIENFNIFIDFMLISLLFVYGYTVKIVTQFLINDKIKQDYLEKFTDEDKKNFSYLKGLRKEVIEKIKNSNNDYIKHIIDTVETHKYDIKSNDYLLYQILGKDKNLGNLSRYSKEVEEIVFIYIGLISSFIVNSIWLLFYSHWIIFLILVIVTTSLILLSKIVIKMATKRYITRNTRLYINYLLENKEEATPPPLS